jgi:ADP-Ribosyltransferase in polyvalent proteins
VVDAEGEPLVVYHGTSADVQAFDPGQLQAEGIHLTADSSVANRYATSRSMDGGRGANVIPLYVKADRVLDVPMINTDVIKDAAASGFDAVRRGDHIVVMRPEQIKSAIGNSGRFDAGSASLTDSRFASWADQINAAIADIRAAAQEAANVQDAPQARADAPADGARQPGQAAQPARADAPGAGPAGAAEQGGGVPAAGGSATEAGLVAARLAEVSQQFPDLTVQMDGMDQPMRLSEFLEQVQREAMEGTDLDIGGNDAPLMQVAATCFLLNGA